MSTDNVVDPAYNAMQEEKFMAVEWLRATSLFAKEPAATYAAIILYEVNKLKEKDRKNEQRRVPGPEVQKSERGFMQPDPIPSTYGGFIRAYESSSMDPHIWVKIVCPADLNDPEGDTIDAVAHITAERAETLRDTLDYLIRNHFLAATPKPEDGMSDRDKFEAWISAPPFERDVSRAPEYTTNGFAWPGQYKDYAVQLAWEAWCAASEQRVEREKALEDALSHTTDLLEGRDFAKRHYEMIERTKANQELLNQESDNE